MDIFYISPEKLSILIQLVLCYFAYKALDQIKAMREQNDLNYKALTISELREFEKIIHEFNQIINEIKKIDNINPLAYIIEMDEFSSSEIKNEKYNSKLLFWNNFYIKNNDLYARSVECANKLEVISTALVFDTIKIQMLENIISNTLCSFVEQMAYTYVRNRNAAVHYYPNTIYLYKKFKPKVKTVDEQLKMIKDEMNGLKK